MPSFSSVESSAENVHFGLASAGGSIIPIGHIVKDVDWKNEEEVINLLTHRFAVGSLPFKARSELYIKLMTALSIDGLIFHVETKDDRKKLRRGIKMKAIQSMLLPEMDYKDGEFVN